MVATALIIIMNMLTIAPMLTVHYPHHVLGYIDAPVTVRFMVRVERTSDQRKIRLLVEGERYLRSSTVFLDEYDEGRKTWDFYYSLPQGAYQVEAEVENNRKKIIAFYRGVLHVL